MKHKHPNASDSLRRIAAAALALLVCLSCLPAALADEDARKIEDALALCAEGVTDPWRLAIYAAGARDVSKETDEKKTVYTFCLRAFDPGLKALGKFSGENINGYLDRLLANIERYELKCSLTATDGEFTAKSVKALQDRVKKAADASQKAFEDTRVLSAFVHSLFFDGFGSSIKKPQNLLTPPDAYTAWVGEHERALAALDARQWAAFFYGQRRQALDVRGGPYAMILRCTHVDMSALLQAASAAAYEKLAFLPRDERLRDNGVENAFRLALADSVISMRKKAKATVDIPINLGVSPFQGDEYEAFLESYRYADTLDSLSQAVDSLPEYAAHPFPKTGRLSGSASGTSIYIKVPKDSAAYYVQLREYWTDELAVTGFVRPGGTCTLRVPSGDYYFVLASGAVWYGEEHLFGADTNIDRTTLVEVANTNYNHTVTLETTPDGNLPYFGADEGDLRQ